MVISESPPPVEPKRGRSIIAQIVSYTHWDKPPNEPGFAAPNPQFPLRLENSKSHQALVHHIYTCQPSGGASHEIGVWFKIPSSDDVNISFQPLICQVHNSLTKLKS